MIRFYTPDIEERGTMPPEESMHCCRVLRMRAGDKVQTVDGCGHAYLCTILDPNPKGVVLEIDSFTNEPKHWKGKLTLAVAPTKNADRMEWLAEKAVEMGIDEIVLLKCEHSERKVMKLERLKKIMISAMKQSLKATLPKLYGPIDIMDFLKENRFGIKVFGYCSPEVERRDFNDVYSSNSDLTVLIGPEGDFSEKEVEIAMNAGYVPVTFGESRLRTETAGIYAVAAFHILANSQNRDNC